MKKDPRFDWVAKLPTFLHLPHFMVYFSNLGPHLEYLRFGHQYVFQDLEDANMIYLGMVLSVSSEARGKGLGTELMRRGYKLAKEVNCVYLSSLPLITGTEAFYGLGLLSIVLKVTYIENDVKL